MPRRNIAERILNFVNMEGGEPNFLATVSLRVERVNGKLFSCNTAVVRNFQNFSWDCSRRGERQRLGTGRGTHGTQCEKALCVQPAGVEIAQVFRHLVAHAEKIGVEKGLALVSNFWCAHSYLVRLFAKRQVAIV